MFSLTLHLLLGKHKNGLGWFCSKSQPHCLLSGEASTGLLKSEPMQNLGDPLGSKEELDGIWGIGTPMRNCSGRMSQKGSSPLELQALLPYEAPLILSRGQGGVLSQDRWAL